MKQNTFKQLVESGAIKSVSFFREINKHGSPIHDWEVWVSDGGNDSTLRPFGLCLEVERGGHKMYTSLDRAHDALRKMGWKGNVVVFEKYH